MQADSICRVLPFFNMSYVPQLTALAASVYATMLFPDVDQEFDRFACALAISLDWRARYSTDETESEDAMPVNRSELLSALDFTRRVPFKKLILLRNEAYSAADILKFAFLLDLDSETTSSIGKAVELTLKCVAVDKRSLTSRWAKFKDVSHLWQAYIDISSTFKEFDPEWESTTWFNFMKDPRPTLAIAKSYRDWGVLHRPSGSKSVPTLNSSSTWSIPENIVPLPMEEFFNKQRLYTGLTEVGRGHLDRYQRK